MLTLLNRKNDWANVQKLWQTIPVCKNQTDALLLRQRAQVFHCLLILTLLTLGPALPTRERVQEKLSLIGLHSQGHLSSMCSGWLYKSGADQKGIIKTWLHFPRGPIQTAMLSYSVATNGLQTIDSPSGEIGYFSLYSSGRFRGGKPTIRIKKWSIIPEDSLKCWSVQQAQEMLTIK